MGIKIYKKKRDFAKTEEPKEDIKKVKSKEKIFVIHFHLSKRPHYDLRLEMNGVLKSWAVPKMPSADKEIKRLAIQVEDHPIEYATFKGIIPEGNYGAGEVKIWDNGNYELIEKTPTKLIIEIHGKKLKGKYALIKTNYTNKKSWLFFKI